MSETNTAELARHLSRLLSDAQLVIHKARLIAGRAKSPALAALMEDVAFKALVEHVSEANRWFRQLATQTKVVTNGNAAALPRLFPELRTGVAHADR